MKITVYSVSDPEFKPYGRIVKGYDEEKQELVKKMKEVITLPESGTGYQAEIEELTSSKDYKSLKYSMFGGLPVEFGSCYGRNTRLNCLEYHRSSEFNMGDEDFILLLAKLDEMEDGMLDTAKVKAFRVPAGELIEVYATTLHFAPCHTDQAKGFRVLVALPSGTNTARPELEVSGSDDDCLWANNKWLLAHPDSVQASKGAKVALKGWNIDLSEAL